MAFPLYYYDHHLVIIIGYFNVVGYTFSEKYILYLLKSFNNNEKRMNHPQIEYYFDYLGKFSLFIHKSCLSFV